MDQISTITEKAIAELNALTKGEKIIYYRGFLAFDRVTNRQAGLIASEALELSLQGKVILTQRRVGVLGTATFDYIAMGA